MSLKLAGMCRASVSGLLFVLDKGAGPAVPRRLSPPVYVRHDVSYDLTLRPIGAPDLTPHRGWRGPITSHAWAAEELEKGQHCHLCRDIAVPGPSDETAAPTSNGRSALDAP